MAEFKDAKLWLKLSFLFSTLMFALHLWAFVVPGWSSGGFCANGNCNGGWYSGVEACEVIGFLCNLTALVLILCLVLLDELKDNKPALICFVVFALLAGLCIIIGIAIYGAEAGSGATYSSLVGVMGGLCGILAGIFGILVLVGK